MNTKYKNFFHKISVLFLIAIILYSTTVPKAQAENTNIEIAKKGFAGVVGTVVALEVAKDMGWKMTKDAWKKITPKVKALVEASYDAWDFTKNKPKKNGKNIDVDVSSLDKAKMATLLKEIGGGLIETSIEIEKNNSKKNLIDVDYSSVDPFYKTSIELDITTGVLPGAWGYQYYAKGLDFYKKMGALKITPDAYGQRLVAVLSFPADSYSKYFYLDGGLYQNPKKYYMTFGYGLMSTTGLYIDAGEVDGRYSSNEDVSFKSIKNSIDAYDMYLRALERANTVYYIGSGIAVPQNNEKVYKIPLETPSTYKLPGDLAKTGSTLKIPLSGDFDGSLVDLEWETIENDYQLTNNVMNYETNYFNDVENTFNSTTFIINNYYTIQEGEKPQEEVDDEINIIIVPPGGGVVVPGEEVDGLNRGLIGFVKQTYGYLADGIDTSLESLKDITDSAMGVVEYLNTSMSWLPSSWRVMFGSAFVLGVVAHFLRR